MQAKDRQGGLVRVFKDVLPESVLRQLLNEAQELANSPNYWMTKEAILGSRPCKRAAEKAIQCLQEEFAVCLPEDLAGAEYWVQVYQPGKGLDFHFDKDETLMKEEAKMRHPHLSSILYLTGSSEMTRLGPTVVIDQYFDNETKSAYPEQPERCAFIWPQQNNLAVFDGALGHGVLDSAAKGERITMLINWWTYQPAAVFEAPEAAAASRSECNRGEDIPATLPCRGSFKEVQVPSITIAESYEPQALTVDDLLQSNELSITGGKAKTAISIQHKGYELYPVPSEQEDQFKSLQTAAAFVSSELLRADSDSEGEQAL